MNRTSASSSEIADASGRSLGAEGMPDRGPRPTSGQERVRERASPQPRAEPVRAVAASPSATAAIAAASAMPLIDGNHMLESTPSARARAPLLGQRRGLWIGRSHRAAARPLKSRTPTTAGPLRCRPRRSFPAPAARRPGRRRGDSIDGRAATAPRKPAADRGLRQAEPAGGLCLRQAVQVAGHDNRPV